jgi:hypothetical protein
MTFLLDYSQSCELQEMEALANVEITFASTKPRWGPIYSAVGGDRYGSKL